MLRPGSLFLVFVAWYRAGRAIEDFFRIDETHGLGMTASQWFAATAVAVAVVLPIRPRRHGVQGGGRRRYLVDAAKGRGCRELKQVGGEVSERARSAQRMSRSIVPYRSRTTPRGKLRIATPTPLTIELMV